MDHKQAEAKIFYCDFAHPLPASQDTDIDDLYVTLTDHVVLCVERDRLLEQLRLCNIDQSNAEAELAEALGLLRRYRLAELRSDHVRRSLHDEADAILSPPPPPPPPPGRSMRGDVPPPEPPPGALLGYSGYIKQENSNG